MNKRPCPVIPLKLRIAIWIAIIVAPILLVIGAIRYVQDKALIESGAKAEGHINSFQRESATKGREIYKFDVTWKNESDNRLYRKNFSTSSAIWAGKPPETTVTVLYDPQNPEGAVIGMKEKPDNEPLFLGFFFTIAGGIAFAYMRHSTKKNSEWLEKELKNNDK